MWLSTIFTHIFFNKIWYLSLIFPILHKQYKSTKLKKDIYQKIQSLNEKLQTVIILRFFEDMKIEEIAKITNVNISTVKSRLYKGLKELKKII